MNLDAGFAVEKLKPPLRSYLENGDPKVLSIAF